jgi:catechol 2,3-dioxygenase-like lactoylglutathione lyase family enzyme
MRVFRLHHAQITIPSGAEEEARAFYCGVLGLEEVAKPDSLQGRGGFWLQSGGQQIHVGTEEGVDRRASKAHLAYQVDDLERFRELLGQNGIATEDGVPIPGYRRFEFRDPFGNRVELIEDASGPG